jgi:hypothetical protein
VITLQELFRFEVDPAASGRTVVGQLESTGLRPGFLDKFDKRGVRLPSWLSGAPGTKTDPVERRAA